MMAAPVSVAAQTNDRGNDLVKQAEAIVDSDADMALGLLDELLERTDELSSEALAHALWIKARALSHKSEYNRAVASAQKALDHAAVDNQILKAEILTTMSASLARLNRSRRAFDLQQEALAIRRQLGDPKGLASSLTTLGELYFDVGLFQQSRAHYEEALAQARLSRDAYSIVRTLNNYAFALLFDNDAETSLILLKEAKARAANIDNARMLAYVSQNIGHSLVRLERYDEAEPYVSAALDYARHSGAPELLTGIYLTLARIEHSRQAFTKAKNYAGAALEYAQATNYTERISDLHRLLAEIEFARGRYQSAYSYLEDHVAFLETMSDAALVRSASLFEGHEELLKNRQDLNLSRQQAEISRLGLARARAIRNGAVFASGLLTLILIGVIIFIREKMRAKQLLEKKNSQLQVACAAADSANKAKSNFLSVMSHELRTPLNAVIGFSDIIEEEKLGPVGQPDYKEFAHHINAQGVRLLSMVEDILLLTDADTGKLSAQDETYAVEAIFRQAVHRLPSFTPDTDKRAITVDNMVGDLKIRCDASLLSRAIAHLVENAIKFTVGPVELQAMVDADECLVLTVTDYGPGFDQGDVQKLMTPFSQADASRSRSHEGAGLGLHVARQIIELHEGALTIETSREAGTTVTMMFPPHRSGSQEATDPNEYRFVVAS